MRVVALFRVSTEKQANEGASLEAQQRDYRELALSRGWETVAEFKGCESATQASSDRRVLQQVLESIRTHRPDAIYVHEQSRLTRGDELEVALLLRELREGSMKILVHGTVRDLSSIDERFMVGIQGCVDRMEAERIAERLSRGKRERARQGRKASGAAPFGYRNPPKGERERGKLAIVPEEAATIRRIYEMAMKGYGNLRIATELNRLGLPASRGGKWVKSAVGRVLANPAYAGISAANVWVGSRKKGFRYDPKNTKAAWVEGAHDAIIDRATWDAINGRAKNPTTMHPRMLTGLLWVQGQRYGGDSSRARSFYRAPRGVGGLPWLDADETDQRVWADFARLATGPEFVASLMESARDRSQEAIVHAEIEHLTDQIERRERRVRNLTDMRMEGDIDAGEFRRKKDEEEGALRGLRADLDAYRAKAAALDARQAPRVARAVQMLLAGQSKLTVEQRRQILRTIVRRVDIATEVAAVPQSRKANGQVVGGRVREWRIKAVTFHLSISNATGGEYGPVGANSAASPAGESGYDDATRSGQLTTTSSDCDQASDAGNGSGTGQLGTTWS